MTGAVTLGEIGFTLGALTARVGYLSPYCRCLDVDGAGR